MINTDLSYHYYLSIFVDNKYTFMMCTDIIPNLHLYNLSVKIIYRSNIHLEVIIIYRFTGCSLYIIHIKYKPVNFYQLAKFTKINENKFYLFSFIQTFICNILHFCQIY